MIKVRIKPELLGLLTSGRFKTFTAPELTKAYLQLPGCQRLDSKATRQFVLKNLYRLEDKKLLEKTGQITGRSIRYRLSREFKEKHLVPGTPFQTTQSVFREGAEGFVSSLKERLNNYKIELLTVIGEVEEYEAISNESPQQQKYIQEPYNRARDHCSKTLGRVRALETLISKQLDL